ncbi:unnamed protein product [Polarella glacialis]|uniref:N-acetyltransferase domain-containing protein n=1 Tax=Polarella glacialis TaxID=89957 RepID=A0A813G0W5_POLGL|nr:unnamed protein product [Polarella glacialis]
MAQRLREAGEFFWALFDAKDDALVGFVCGTCAKGSSLTHESMEEHVPGGALLCVHSVVVRPDLQRRGIAAAMLREYLRAVAADSAATGRVVPKISALISKAKLVALYVKAGFQLAGLSPVVHGADPWFELRVESIAAAAAEEEMLQCDAFAAEPCAGNPAAVVFTHRGGDERWMQRVALEQNLSETAFVERLSAEEADEQPSRFGLRWFTPTCEVDLCGHATLGAAHALWATGRVEKNRTIEFSTQTSGVLTCKQTSGGWIEMDFPADPPSLAGAEAVPGRPSPPALAKALGVEGVFVPAVGRGCFDILVELTPDSFDAMAPDQSALASFDCRGIMVTTRGCEGSRDGPRAASTAKAAASLADAWLQLVLFLILLLLFLLLFAVVLFVLFLFEP